MGIRLAWDGPSKTVVRMALQGNWTIEDFLDSVTQLTVMLDMVGHETDLIIDATRSASAPQGARALSESKKLFSIAGVDRVVLVGPPDYRAMLVQTFGDLYNTPHLTLANTLLEAYERLAINPPAQEKQLDKLAHICDSICRFVFGINGTMHGPIDSSSHGPDDTPGHGVCATDPHGVNRFLATTE